MLIRAFICLLRNLITRFARIVALNIFLKPLKTNPTVSRQHKKILIIAPAWIGDMVMAQALFKQLQRQYGQLLLDVVAPASTYPLLQWMPEVRQGFCLAVKHGELGLKVRWRLAKILRREHYDQAIVLPNSWKSALLPFFARICQRTGWLGEMRYGLLNDYRHLDKKKLPLMVQRFLVLASERKPTSNQEAIWTANHQAWRSLWPTLAVNSQQLTAVRSHFKLNPQAKPVIVLCSGAAYGESKRWPVAYFAELARTQIKAGYQVWLLASSAEQAQADAIQAASGDSCHNLAGQTNLAQAITLLSFASAVVSNDTGLMHIACALKRPTVVIYGSSSASFTPPLATAVRCLSLGLDCQPCFQRKCPLTHLRCLRDLKPDRVLQALASLL